MRRFHAILVPLLLGLAAAAPFLYALQLTPFSLTPDFWIPAERPTARAGALISMGLVFLSAVLVVGMRNPEARLLGQRARGATFLGLLFGLTVFGLYLFTFTFSAHGAFFSADQDVTNVSTALARTTVSDLLPSPYVAAGSSRSFLAHHFSPSLLLFLPAYRLGSLFDLDHNLYDIVLACTILCGLGLWLYYGFRVSGDQTLFLPLLLVPFSHSFLLLRQVVSFHFEVLAIPLLALLLLSLRLNQRRDVPARARWLARLWPLFACLYLGIKEDMGAYLAFFAGVFLLGDWVDAMIAQRKDGRLGRFQPFLRNARVGLQSLLSVLRQSLYARLLVLSIIWLVVAVSMRLWIAGEGAPGWESYWNPAHYPPFRKTPYAYGLILISSGLWIFFSARSLTVVLGVLVLHIVSGMPWHALLESHYSYTLLPFVFAGSVRGLANLYRRLQEGKISWSLLVVLVFGGAMVADYALAREKNQPFGLMMRHPGYTAVEAALKSVPAGACVQSSFHLSALVPLRARPLPFTFYEGSPWEKILPRGCEIAQFRPTLMARECQGLYRLLPGHPGGCLGEEMGRFGDYVYDGEGALLWKLRQ